VICKEKLGKRGERVYRSYSDGHKIIISLLEDHSAEKGGERNLYDEGKRTKVLAGETKETLIDRSH